MSYHRNDRSQYVSSGKVLDDESLETLTAYFQAIHDQKVSDGTLQRQQQVLESAWRCRGLLGHLLVVRLGGCEAAKYSERAP